jgi:hypothetical protein
MGFFAGFVGATFVGLAASAIAGVLANIQAGLAGMTSSPQPALREVPRTDGISGIVAEPDASPIQVLIGGCSAIIANLLLMIAILASIGALIVLIPGDVLPRRLPEEFWVGVLYAGLLGILMNTILWNWGTIVNLFNRMVNHPNPTLPLTEPPNQHHVGAAPPQTPPQIVFGGCIEILLRAVLQAILLGTLAFSTWQVLRYLFR